MGSKYNLLRKKCSSTLNMINEQKNIRRDLSLPTLPITSCSIQRNEFKELNCFAIARQRSFSNWPHSSPSREVLASSGWFYTNISDRVFCIFCNTICHRWTCNDNPYEVHVRLAPKCPFVLSRPTLLQDSSPSLITQNPQGQFIMSYPLMSEIFRRQETFNNNSWTMPSPSVIELIEAGFFYSGVENTVTCFYCGGSLHRWSSNDTPKIEHARWFPHCLYIKHLCGTNLYDKIQIRKRQLDIEKNAVDKETRMRRQIKARLDLPIAQRLCKIYGIAIVKRCMEQQWMINNDDFESDEDLTMACFILKKLIDAYKGGANRIQVPTQSHVSIDSNKKEDKNIQECVVCLTKERQLACLPCGHFCTCVVCGYGLGVCPLCREKIQSFVRIYC